MSVFAGRDVIVLALSFCGVACVLPWEEGEAPPVVDPVSADVAAACERTATPGCLATCKNTGKCFTGDANEVRDVHCNEQWVTFYSRGTTFEDCLLTSGSTVPDTGTDLTIVAARKRAFVTNDTWDGNLVEAGGDPDALRSADRLCSNASTKVGLAGIWKAFVATSSTAASKRVMDGPRYTISRSKLLFANLAELDSATPDLSGITDETGAATGNDVWSGEGCSNWTSASIEAKGAAKAVSGYSATDDCEQKNSLLCVEQ